MTVRILTLAALLLLAPLAAAEAAPRSAPDPAAIAATPHESYAAYRGHRSRWAHRHRRHHARPWWLVTHPTWPGCYDRYPFYCPTPVYSRHVVRHRYRRGTVVSVRG